MYCINCGQEITNGGKYCNHCGSSIESASLNTIAPQLENKNIQTSSRDKGKTISIVGIVLALVALLFFPPFIGTAALVCGIVGTVQSRDKTLGIIAIVMSMVCMSVGIWLGVLTDSSL